MSWLQVFSFAALLGLASSVHCAGMCGVFAVKAAQAKVQGFGLYLFGKVFSYAFLGALAGWLGSKIIDDSTLIAAYAAVMAGAVLILAGAKALLPNKAIAPWTKHMVTWLGPLIALARREGGKMGSFSLGALTGLLPCGVVYIAAAQAIVAGSIVKSVVLMATLALGTAPALIFVGFLSGRVQGLLGPQRLRYLGPLILLVMGLLTMWRALQPILAEPGSVPCCH